jgi:quercetin dioxygenase-like cupin family protein
MTTWSSRHEQRRELRIRSNDAIAARPSECTLGFMTVVTKNRSDLTTYFQSPWRRKSRRNDRTQPEGERGSTFHSASDATIAPAILTPEVQKAVCFLGALVRIRVGGEATDGRLAVLEHHAERGYTCPVHRHHADDETFLVLEGELRVECGEEVWAAGAGGVAFLPRQVPHAFVVTSPQARILTLHTPARFDEFVLTAGTVAPPVGTMAPEEAPPDPAALAAMASSYGIEILGPPLVP